VIAAPHPARLQYVSATGLIPAPDCGDEIHARAILPLAAQGMSVRGGIVRRELG